MSYWQAGDKITLPQTDVKITAEGPTNFQENNVIGIYIPPSIKYFSGKDCLLEFDVLLNGDAAHSAQRLCLDSQIGANSLFSMCRVYAGNRATLLEETDEYATMVGLKYSYDTNDSKRQSRALTEGCGAYTADGRGTFGTMKSTQNNMVSSPFYSTPNLLVDDDTDITVAPSQLKAKVSLQIHMGVFANNTKAFPNMLTDGCYVELTCASNRGVFRVLDGTTEKRSPQLNPEFGGIDAAGAPVATGVAFTSIFSTNANAQIDAAHSPFVVGEELVLYNWKAGTFASFPAGCHITTIKTTGGVVEYVLDDTALGGSVITANDIPGTAAGLEGWVLVSRSNQVGASAWAPTYTISDVNLIIRRIDMGAQYENSMVGRMKEGGVIMFDIPSVQCHKQSILAGDVQATISLPIEHAKARSIINVPTDAAIYSTRVSTDGDGTYLVFTDDRNGSYYSDRTGISGIGNNLSEYSYLLEGRIVPSRPITTSKSATTTGGVDANHLIELEKALQSAGIVPLSFQDYKKNFCIGRALTLDRNTIFDGRNKDCRLNVKYEGTAPPKDTLWKSYVFHIRTLAIRGNNISVEV